MQISNAARLLNDSFNNSPSNSTDNVDVLDNFNVFRLIVYCRFISCIRLLLIYISQYISCLISSKSAITGYFALRILNSADLLVYGRHNAY